MVTTSLGGLIPNLCGYCIYLTCSILFSGIEGYWSSMMISFIQAPLTMLTDSNEHCWNDGITHHATHYAMAIQCSLLPPLQAYVILYVISGDINLQFPHCASCNEHPGGGSWKRKMWCTSPHPWGNTWYVPQYIYEIHAASYGIADHAFTGYLVSKLMLESISSISYQLSKHGVPYINIFPSKHSAFVMRFAIATQCMESDLLVTLVPLQC